jgi:Ca-activated chloride channel family protein
VIDTSGSMVGPKMEEARKALRHFVNGLNPGDRFNIVDFSTEARRFREGLVEASEEGRRQALAYIDQLQARGGTNIEEALRSALAMLDSAPGDERFKLVALITDGEPTVGVTRPEDIVRSVREKNVRGRRIFAFGVGVDLNAQLLERLAQENHGSLDYVLQGEDLEVKLSAFWDKIDFPVLTDIRLEFPNASVSDLFPRPLPDLFRGDQLSVAGRYREDGRHAVVLRAKFQGEERLFEYSLDFTPGLAASGSPGVNDFIPRLWATRKIGYLLEAMRLSGESKEVKDEVIRLSQEFGILTPYTSYLILEEGAARVPTAAPARRLYAWEALRDAPREESAAGGVMRRELHEAKQSLEARSGAPAVDGSRAVSNLKAGEAEAADRFLGLVNSSQKQVKQVGARAFYREGERWIEGGLSETELSSARRVAYLSDQYFALLSKSPGIGELLGVGQKVSFRFGGEVIIVE